MRQAFAEIYTEKRWLEDCFAAQDRAATRFAKWCEDELSWMLHEEIDFHEQTFGRYQIPEPPDETMRELAAVVQTAEYQDF